jgi:hypothetical protein
MEIKGIVVSVKQNETIEKQDGSTYKGAVLVYNSDKGEQKQVFHSNALKYNAALKNALAELSPGDNIVITKEKEGEYWNVKGIRKDATPAAKKTYDDGRWEDREERAVRQKVIVRQSSLTNALKLLELQGKKSADQFEVMNLAAQFTAWVLDEKQEISNDISSIMDDIPL